LEKLIMTQPSTRRDFITAGVVTGAELGIASSKSNAAEQYPRNLTKDDIDRWMTELANWGKWGPDDHAGTVNLITPAKRKAAASLVKEGVSVSLSLDADLPKEGTTNVPLQSGRGGGRGNPQTGAPGAGVMPAAANSAGAGNQASRGQGGGTPRATWSLASTPPGPEPRQDPAYVVDTISVSYHGNASTHLDALSHLYWRGKIYNGHPQTSYTDRGAGNNDVMAFKNGIFTRGVLFDIARLKNVPYLGDDEAIFPEDLDAWEKRAGFKAESGDVVLFRTGRWARVAAKGPLNLGQVAPGMYASCAKWLKERGCAVLGSDVVQDVRPSRIEGVNQPMHQVMLYAVGTPLIDNCDLEAVAEAAAQRRRWAFLLTLNPLRVPGATGSPANPIAVF
jgi:kynurenine formamidase